MPALANKIPDVFPDDISSSANGLIRNFLDLVAGGNGVDLELFSEPALAVDRAGDIVEANSAMRRVLGENILILNNHLRFADADARSRLEALLSAIKDQSQPPNVEPIVVRGDDDAPVVMRMLAVPEGAQGLFPGVAAIFVFICLMPRFDLRPTLLSRIFGLTPAESRLAAALANGSTLTQAARNLNISWETARTHLKTVFSKTNTHRQSELVALLSRL
jgi:DNA-binding CsgD family transcriptional regulator